MGGWVGGRMEVFPTTRSCLLLSCALTYSDGLALPPKQEGHY